MGIVWNLKIINALGIAIIGTGIAVASGTGTVSPSGVVGTSCNLLVSPTVGVNLFTPPLLTDTQIGTMALTCNHPGNVRVRFNSANGGRLNGPGGAFANYSFRSPGFNLDLSTRSCAESGFVLGWNHGNWVMTSDFDNIYDSLSGTFLTTRTQNLCARVSSLPSPLFGGAYTDTVTITATPL